NASAQQKEQRHVSQSSQALPWKHLLILPPYPPPPPELTQVQVMVTIPWTVRGTGLWASGRRAGSGGSRL
ncbi:hypothetical protein EI555_020967, partial [Monodon monoceros]